MIDERLTDAAFAGPELVRHIGAVGREAGIRPFRQLFARGELADDVAMLSIWIALALFHPCPLRAEGGQSEDGDLSLCPASGIAGRRAAIGQRSDRPEGERNQRILEVPDMVEDRFPRDIGVWSLKIGAKNPVGGVVAIGVLGVIPEIIFCQLVRAKEASAVPAVHTVGLDLIFP
jgi:hypothetical protein